MSVKGFGLERSRLSAALFAALVMPVAGVAFAQDAATAPDQTSQDQTSTTNKATTLDKVIVTGSLIPQTELETFQPVTIISAEDLQTRGFTSVADALQRSSFATGTVQGNQTSASFTQGAETISLFGLNPGYTKFLIDGRPMANYPALYNGSDVFNNVSGIPIDLVERIEVLPGGQSSLYGSDAIAGVVNIILKKKLDGAIISARIGQYTDGGGDSQRISIADSFSNADGRLNVLLGGQFEHADPIWAYDRDLTRQINENAYGGAPPVASRDFLIISAFTSYHFLDPNNCANVTSGFGGTEQLSHRPPASRAPYCGSLFSPGYRTLKNGKESMQAYSHATFDVNDNVQIYGDLLLNKESSRYHIGAGYTFYDTRDIAPGIGFYDPNEDDFFTLQRAFMPEDMGGWERSMNRDDSRSYSATFGVNGTVGDSAWDYDVGFTRTEYHLTEHSFARLRDPINAYFQTHVLGPQATNPDGSLMFDPYYDYYPVFTPDYAAFYTLINQADFDNFTTSTTNRSKTYDNVLRAQIVNGSLFSLPGGDAGIAVAVEGGTQGWEYNPDALLVPDPVSLQSEIWGTTSVSGNGSRSRYAVTGEMRLPIWEPLTISLSGRYDSYSAAGRKISSPTYNIGIEYQPIESLLFRGRYGTAFKAPTLADQFQGLSGFYSFTTDYLACNQAGFDPSQIANCPTNIASVQYFGTQQGNPDLEPIKADNWSYGVVWAPTPRFSIGADYQHFDIRNEVAGQSITQLLIDEARCTPVAQGGTGQLDPNSGTCQAAFGQITRDGQGTIQQIDVFRINVAKEVVNAVTLNVHYLQPLGSFGDLMFNGSATHMIKHDSQTFPTDPTLDLLDPFNSQDPKTKANASLAWHKSNWTATLYADWMSGTPNNRLWLLNQTRTLPNGTVVDNPDTRYLPHYTTYNASLNWDATEDLTLSLLVNNLTNKYPDNDDTYDNLTGAPYDSNEYSAYGRSVYLEARWNFGKAE
jgi:outer membrane receptor protein involved in Fe transport